MPDFAAMIAYFKGPKKDMIGYTDLPTIDADSKKDLYLGCQKKYSKLSAPLALLRFKAANSLSNKGFTKLLALFKIRENSNTKIMKSPTLSVGP